MKPLKNPKTIRVNWETIIRCVDCKTSFTISGDPSVGLVDERARTRMILLQVPNECPECHSMRLVGLVP